jgi:hypothetical protein
MEQKASIELLHKLSKSIIAIDYLTIKLQAIIEVIEVLAVVNLFPNFTQYNTIVPEMAEACVKHCECMKQESGGDSLSVPQLLAGVRVLTTPGGTLEELLSALTTLPDCLQSLPQVCK